MEWEKGDFLNEGKGKNIYAVKNHPDLIWMEFKNNLTAFNGKKQSSFKGKGALNRDTSSLIFRFLTKEGIKNHRVEDTDRTGMICRRLKILPLEVVVRNRLSGSTARKFQLPEGRTLSEPLIEFYYKNDALGDPFISSEQAVVFKFVSEWREIEILKRDARRINEKLKNLFDLAGIELIDFKLEFGKCEKQKSSSTKQPSMDSGSSVRSSEIKHPPETRQNQLTDDQKEMFLLADEISCDSCRLWDKQTKEKLDKDRFRFDMGGVEESYKKVRDSLFRIEIGK